MFHVSQFLVLLLHAAGQTPELPPVTTETPPVVATPITVGTTWKVGTVRVPVAGTFGGTRDELRVLREDGGAVSVGEGLEDSGDAVLIATRTGQQVEQPLGVMNSVQHALVLGFGAAIAVVGGLAGVAGTYFTATAYTGSTPVTVPDVLQYDHELWRTQGYALLGTAALLGATGIATIIAVGAHWGFQFASVKQGPDLAALDGLKTVFSWDASDAAKVVERHNRKALTHP